MSKHNVTETMAFNSDEVRRDRIKEILAEVESALEERGYQSVSQISGYLISNDPAYISSHNNARVKIQEVERYEIIEELVRFYLSEK
ncbi:MULTISPECIES: IreB family regulatory phosphoprotein [Erysipelothrix]|uniref:IreB family regulatory phosphoprotein n=1 Tax=Erysipelothrix piscisicarius TaxID=2485784 RepID=A0A3Q8S339_9FIRM|nr:MULTISPECIES: IreB family regulatory phosphoprotein [Erysipelothrix]AZK44583.1 IreB family regulatory phosphoprotein [Erysipelothrix piscisicarius]MBK2401885.1 IreB family regulatory phosphoprotein [Erysipelothrix sp. strain 2 (EsS2-6-Brazil)]MBK2404227.1 IreB family regulatory phosphoprotein [Erysipelothrix sp. strain 2 (EsS2-7-Brazil)]NBA00973.1 IreB family regulatory phosphoprotein [Erysipelothrix rhusiopathiae]